MRKDGQTDITKLIPAFRNFGNALKNEWTAVLQFAVNKCFNFNSHTDLDYKIYEGKAPKYYGYYKSFDRNNIYFHLLGSADTSFYVGSINKASLHGFHVGVFQDSCDTTPDHFFIGSRYTEDKQNLHLQGPTGSKPEFFSGLLRNIGNR